MSFEREKNFLLYRSELLVLVLKLISIQRIRTREICFFFYFLLFHAKKYLHFHTVTSSNIVFWFRYLETLHFIPMHQIYSEEQNYGIYISFTKNRRTNFEVSRFLLMFSQITIHEPQDHPKTSLSVNMQGNPRQSISSRLQEQGLSQTTNFASWPVTTSWTRWMGRGAVGHWP